MSKRKEHELTLLVGYLYQALQAEYGIEVLTDDPKRARMRLYEARRFAKDSALDCLQLRLSPSDYRAILIVKGQERDQEDEP